MPVVDIDMDELRRLTGHDEKSDSEFKSDLFALGLEFEGKTESDLLQFEFGPDRLDRLSVEGVARSLRYHYGDDRGIAVPSTNNPEFQFIVSDDVPDSRPYVTGAVARGINLDQRALDSLIQLQEKLHATIGRKRTKGAIGIHDLTMLKGRTLDDSGLDLSGGAGGGMIDTATDSRPTADRASETSASDSPTHSITYTGIEPTGDTFVPLDSNRELTPAAVLDEHPTGETYADIVTDYDRYPAIYDELGLFSFPPVINGRRTEVSANSRDLLIELTGTDQWTIDRMCTIICYALKARGATIESVDVEYPDRALTRPDLTVDTKHISHDRIETILGVSFDTAEVIELFERAGLAATTTDDTTATDTATPAVTSDRDIDISDESPVYAVSIPPYRVDVLHPLDLVDDVGRAYGFDNLEPRYPDIGTVGGRHERSRLETVTRTALTGLGFEDLLNFHLTNKPAVYDRMQMSPLSATKFDSANDDITLGSAPPAEITDPYSGDYTILRPWILPSLIQVLENNTHRAYPQDLSEVGFVANHDDSVNTRVAERRHVAGAVARHDATYEDAKAPLQALCRDFDVELQTPPTTHPSFIDGRTAAIMIDGNSIGVIGEVHPEVLVEHDLAVPVAAFEFELTALGANMSELPDSEHIE
ncbi:phenylalanine--tRNA ligase subunit beta [Haloquadratum walsbyi]|jgi:phenylalanyl-tRNA synthetase beta subunit (EC 6.1.1.20)|uniref:Phenylalanine--tRNA ligase beta subunit n=1 Tax=Haloquadratum walsbyi J07HQW2 TaxID=1238425 RepID=U1NGM5_9EURY|nr:phenylalanine--tRNA ligase subunit beta [Haloquadratum walsbyi]ERG95983.1 MAG: phenylalanyl-tRNA synthetase, beta subunit [Haloquadratum walsbyi J07HQW2]